MKPLLHVLYVTTEDSYLFMEGESICVKPPGGQKERIPPGRLESIVLFGNCSASSPLLAFCMKRGIGVSFMSKYGRFLAGVHGPVSGNVLLRLAQFRAAENPTVRAAVAHRIVAGKAANMRGMLLRAAREQTEDSAALELRKAAREIGMLVKQMPDDALLESLRGFEGQMSRIYFSAFNKMIKASPEDFYIERRDKRPPPDYTNTLLSYMYTLLAHDVRCALEGVGLDPQVGFLHMPRSGRASLALDIIEELRAPLCDRFCLSQINLRSIQKSDFTDDPGVPRLKDDSRKKLLTAWQKRKAEEIVHPFLEEKISIGLIPHIQSRLLSMYLRGDLESYVPFWWR